MSEGMLLLAVLCFFYLFDCFILIRKQTVAFVSPFFGKFSSSRGIQIFSNAKFDIVLTNPLPPLGRLYLCHLYPVSISPSGLCAFNPQSLPEADRASQTGKFIKISDITSCCASGKSLFINDTMFVECATARHASSLADLITKMIDAPPEKREGLIMNFINAQFDINTANKRLELCRDFLFISNLLGSILFFLLFIFAPMAVFFFGLENVLIPVALIMLLMAFLLSVIFFYKHKLTYPESKSERITNLIKMIFFPPYSIRIADLISSEILSDLNPVTVASVLSPQVTDGFIKAYMRDLKYPIGYLMLDSEAKDVCDWYSRQIYSSSLEFLGERQGLSQKDIFDHTQEPGMKAYCPRCLSSFSNIMNECSCCTGISLVSYKSKNQPHMEH